MYLLRTCIDRGPMPTLVWVSELKGEDSQHRHSCASSATKRSGIRAISRHGVQPMSGVNMYMYSYM